MSKRAEEAAMKAYPVAPFGPQNITADDCNRQVFIRGYEQAEKDLAASPRQALPEADLEKLVNEEFASRCRTTEHGPEVAYNRDDLYRLIKRLALMFNTRKEE